MAELTAAQKRDAIIRTVIGEAANQGPQGMAAVASVINNRANSGQFGSTDPYDVATQHRGGWYQFTANADAAHGGNSVGQNASVNGRTYQQAAAAVDGVLDGTIADPTGGATYYHTADSTAPWDRHMNQTGQVGAHVFYSPHPVPPTDGSAYAGAVPPTSAQQAISAATSTPPLPRARPVSTANAGDSLAQNPAPGAPSLADGLTIPNVDAGMQDGQMRPLLTENAQANFAPSPQVASTNAPGQVSTMAMNGRALPRGAGLSAMPMNDPTSYAQPPHSLTPAPMQDAAPGLRTGLAGLPATSTAPIPQPASERPQATNSKGYVTDQVYTMANGSTWKANADGSFEKVASTPRAPTAIQTLIEASKPGVMGTIGSTVDNAKQFGSSTVDAAKNVGSSIGAAATGLGGLVSGLFNHPSTPAPSAYHAPPMSQTPQTAWQDQNAPSISNADAADLLGYAVPKTVSQTVANPEYAKWLNSQGSPVGVSGGAVGGIGEGGFASGAIDMGMGTPAFVGPKTITRQVPNPAYHPPSTDVAPALRQQLGDTQPQGILGLMGIRPQTSTPTQLQQLGASLTKQQVKASDPNLILALSQGRGGYTPTGSNTLMPSTTLSGGFRQSYGDSSSSGSLASRG